MLQRYVINLDYPNFLDNFYFIPLIKIKYDEDVKTVLNVII